MYFKNTKRYRRLTRLRKKTKKYTNKKKKVHFGGGCGASSAYTIQSRQRVDELTEIKQLKSKNKNRRKAISLHKAVCSGFNFMYDFNRNLIVYKPYSFTRVVSFPDLDLYKIFVISNSYSCNVGLENYDQLTNAPDTLKRDYESVIRKILLQNQPDEEGKFEYANLHYDTISLPDGSILVVDSLGIISDIQPSCVHVTEGISPEMVNVFCKDVLMNPHKYPRYDSTIHSKYGMLTIEDIHTIISSTIHRGQPSHVHADGSGSDSDSDMRQLVSRRSRSRSGRRYRR